MTFLCFIYKHFIKDIEDIIRSMILTYTYLDMLTYILFLIINSTLNSIKKIRSIYLKLIKETISILQGSLLHLHKLKHLHLYIIETMTPSFRKRYIFNYNLSELVGI